MPLLFSYGTLQEPRVQLALFGYTLDGTPDALTGFVRVLRSQTIILDLILDLFYV